mgnify:CR=1 FL=1
MKKLRPSIYASLLILFFLLQFSFLKPRTQSFNFSDENEHLTPAWMMAEKHKSLYRDLSTNHQPLPIITAFAFWKIIRFTNLFMLIERVRQFMLLLSFLGAFLLSIRFGARGFIASIFIEILKFYFFGYHLLAESLVVYPLMYLSGVVGEFSFLNIKNGKWLKFDEGIFGICIFWVAFNLLPAWPFLFFITALFLYLKPKTLKRASILNTLLPFFIPTFILFTAINPLRWFQEAVINNFKYFLPYDTSLTAQSYLSFLIYPFLSLQSLSQVIARYYLLLLIPASISAAIILLKSQRKIRTGVIFLLFYFMLILLNLRITTLNIGFYTAFHVLPQAAFFTMLTIQFVYLAYKALTIPSERKIFSGIMTVIGIVLIANSSIWWRESALFDKWNEHFIQYGDNESIGMAISAIKLNGDTLLAGEQNGFINITAGVPLATRQTAYLSWGYRSPDLKNEFESVLKNSPPVFIFFPQSGNPYFMALKQTLDEKYIRIRRTFGGDTNLYMLATEVSKRTPEEWGKFSGLLYKPPAN